MISPILKKIIIVEINERRAERLEELLNESVPKDIFIKDNITVPDSTTDQKIQKIDEAGDQSEAKPLIFVTMPFDKKFVDRYEFGIKSQSYLVSNICKEEYNIAHYLNRNATKEILIPIYLYSTQLPVYMKLVQYIDCREGDNHKLKKCYTDFIIYVFRSLYK